MSTLPSLSPPLLRSRFHFSHLPPLLRPPTASMTASTGLSSSSQSPQWSQRHHSLVRARPTRCPLLFRSSTSPTSSTSDPQPFPPLPRLRSAGRRNRWRWWTSPRTTMSLRGTRSGAASPQRRRATPLRRLLPSLCAGHPQSCIHPLSLHLFFRQLTSYNPPLPQRVHLHLPHPPCIHPLTAWSPSCPSMWISSSPAYLPCSPSPHLRPGHPLHLPTPSSTTATRSPHSISVLPRLASLASLDR